MKCWDEQSIRRILPDQIGEGIFSMPDALLQDLEEIRLRLNGVATVRVKGRELPLLHHGGTIPVRVQILELLLERATDHSVYASEEYLRQGFVTVAGGHRIGFCGQAVMEGGQIRGLRALSSASIRIARAVPAYEQQLKPHIHMQTGSVLVIGPPGAGKTTLLRALTRLLSDKLQNNVSLIDERFEIAACRHGQAAFSVGTRTDVISGCPKVKALYLMMRNMTPQWLVVDEITEASDLDAIRQAAYCGVKLAATAHAANKTDLLDRELYRNLLDCGIFSTLITISMNRQITVEALV